MIVGNLKVEQILEEWKVDAVYDESKLSYEIIRTPSLHAKYLEYFMHFKHRLSAAEAAKSRMGWQKRKYFRGEMDLSDLQKFGWSQWNGLKPSGAELNQLLEFDSDMATLTQAVADLKAAVTGCEYILGQLKSREFSLKSLVEYQRFLSGN